MVKNINSIKKVAATNGAEMKLDELKQATEIYLNNKFHQIKEDMVGLEVHIQNFLTSEDEDSIQEICKEYVKIQENIKSSFTKTLDEEIYNEFKSEIKDILSTYLEASAWYCGSPSHSFQVVACIQQSLLTDLFSFSTDIVVESANELQFYHDQLSEGLDYVFDYISSQEEENEEIIESINKIQELKYIANAKDLEKIALNNDYEFKSQKGSHKKYEHKITKKCIEIPFHSNADMKLGTSYAIQRQIIENAIA